MLFFTMKLAAHSAILQTQWAKMETEVYPRTNGNSIIKKIGKRKKIE